jgi:glyoxylase-like metal-dependent hydrolase (beta-lactamase superfamily II)
VSVRVRLLVAGNSRQSERFSRRRGGGGHVRFPATVALLQHEQHGAVLFDTGYADRYFTATTPLPQRLYRWLLPVELPAGHSASAQLAALGVRPTEVGTVVLSHLHADHLAGLGDFPAAGVVWAAATSLHGALPGRRPSFTTAVRTTRHGFLPELLPADVLSRLTPAEELPAADTGLPGFEAGHDLFGDGSALLVPLPGHCPGHLGLWLPRTQGPPLFLVGDACWHREAFRSGDLPPERVLSMLSDAADYRATVDRLAGLARARPDILIVPSHCSTSVAEATRVLG